MVQRVAIIGECMLELRGAWPADADSKLALPAEVAFGGDTLNVAVYLSRLGHRVDYLTGLGDEALADWMLNHWRNEGIGCEHVWRETGATTGLYLIETDEDGERRFRYWRQNSPARRLFDDTERAEALYEHMSQCDLVYFSGITLSIYSPEARDALLQFLAGFRRNGGTVAFDSNYRPAQWRDREVALRVFEQAYRVTDIALPTLGDEQALFGEVNPEHSIERLRDWGVDELVLKDGAAGCIVVADDESIVVAAEDVARVVDTTAAGDSFNAGYLAGRLAGDSAEASARAGHRLAARVVQNRGAIIAREQMP